MRRGWLVPGFVLAAGCAFAQTDTFEIRGVVAEPGLGFGVAGAEVTLSEVDVADNRLTSTPFGSVFTDKSGAFEFHPKHAGDYILNVKKADYLGVSIIGAVEKGGAAVPVRLDRAHPSQQVRVSLARPGEITGRVVDEEGNPVAKLRVEASSGLWPLGAAATTGPDGDLTIPRLAPEDYLVKLAPRGPAMQMPPFSEADRKAVDRDLETSYWPGGFDTPSARLTVGSGASASVGTIVARTRTYYSARVSAPSTDCESGAKWSFFVFDGASDNAPRHEQVPCGAEFLVKRLKPGSYWFALSNQQYGDEARSALAAVNVTEENADVELTMGPGATVRGRVVAAAGASLPALDNLKIRSMAREGATVQEPAVASPDKDGWFLLRNLWPRQLLGVTGLGGRYYVQEIRVNGAATAGNIVLAGADNQAEVVVADNGASVSGTVMAGDKPAQRATVLLCSADQRQMSQSNTEGGFRFTGLRPGEYGVVAVPQGVPLDPGLDAARLCSGAQSITLDPSSAKNVSLTVTEPGH